MNRREEQDISEDDLGADEDVVQAARSSAEGELAEALYSRITQAAPERRLDPTRRVLSLLGDPHRAYRIVHVTGTNGKTSTSCITETILRAHGYRTALFTSPDLGHINQRIRINGSPVDAERLVEYWRAVADAVTATDAELVDSGRPPLTFFEALTVLAFYTFAREHAEVAVIEVGLGGQWDPTNVADGDVAVFTPIDVDHIDLLGGTIGEIARAKGGIIKPHAIAVSATQPADALFSLTRFADEREVPFWLEGDRFSVCGRRHTAQGHLIDVAGSAGTYPDLLLPLRGAHQAQNAAVAIAATEALLTEGQRPLDLAVVRRGIAAASSPGRLEHLPGQPLVIVDAAHNPHGVAATMRSLHEEFSGGKLIGVVAILEEKDHSGIFVEMRGVFAELIVTTAPSPRAVPPEQLAAEAAKTGASVLVIDDPEHALQVARSRATADDAAAVVVLGSITLVSLARNWAQER
ncbi:glutamate ligase domain-containing protein [Nocardia sp. R6R-6]|uniref:glutamate ligase domain-containing protein n=1 Tax=Nocardia sp. R6R-6 TaxID=3459303 RepID=UPI00403DAEB1